MEREYFGKIYILVESDSYIACAKCPFISILHGCKIGPNPCGYIGNEKMYWKEKDESLKK